MRHLKCCDICCPMFCNLLMVITSITINYSSYCKLISRRRLSNLILCTLHTILTQLPSKLLILLASRTVWWLSIHFSFSLSNECFRYNCIRMYDNVGITAAPLQCTNHQRQCRLALALARGGLVSCR